MTEKRAGPQLACGKEDADGSLVINIRVQARSSQLAIGAVENGRLKLRLTAPPVDGKANLQAATLLAKAFGTARSRIELIRGRTNRDKSFRITGMTRMPPMVLTGQTQTDTGQVD